MASRLEEYSLVVGNIYDAALDPKKWPIALTSIVRFMSSERGILHTPFLSNSEGRVAFAIGIEDIWLQRYGEHFHKIDLWNNLAVERDFAYDGKVFLGEELVPTRQLLKSPFYSEFLRFSDVVHNCVGVIFGSGSSHGPTTAISCFRGRRAKKFRAEDKSKLALLVSHLSKAIGVQFRLMGTELQLAATLAALDRLAHGILLINEIQKVVYVNAHAETILARGDGLILDISNGEMSCVLPQDTRKLQSAIKAACSPDFLLERHFSEAISVQRQQGRHPYLVHISALPTENSFSYERSRASAILFISSAEDIHLTSYDNLDKLYGLTKKEIELVQALLSGESLRNYSFASHISYETARMHLRNVFAKTQTKRQTELLRLLLAATGPFRKPTKSVTS
jgi:DNA-binding CsgD family transcriptional regulator